MKVYVQIVDLHSGIYQCGMIDEPIQKGFEVANAIAHFGLNSNGVDWDVEKSPLHKFGRVTGTSKVVSVITPENIAPENIAPESII